MAKSAAERAYDAAVKEIRRVAGAGETTLDLNAEPYRALDRIPDEITTLTALQSLSLAQTAVTDLAPLAALTALQSLSLAETAVTDLAPLTGLTALHTLDLTETAVTNVAPLAKLSALRVLSVALTGVTDLAPLAGLTTLHALLLTQTAVADLIPVAGLTALSNLSLNETLVADLRPIRGLAQLGTSSDPGLTFLTTPATTLDGDLSRLAMITIKQDRARQTLAYLNTLPPWPEPYTPRARPDGQPPQPIGRASELAQLLPALRTPGLRLVRCSAMPLSRGSRRPSLPIRSPLPFAGCPLAMATSFRPFCS